jgi:hypothetical protein
MVSPVAALGRDGGAVGFGAEVTADPVGVPAVGALDVGGSVFGRPASGLSLLQPVSRAAQRQARVRAVACLLRVVTVVTSP